MVEGDAQVLLRDVEQLRRQVRRDRHTASVPLLLFGVLTAASARVADPRYGGPAWWAPGLEYWAVAAPVGLLLMAWWYRRQRHRTGVGGPAGWPAAALAAATIALVVALPAALVVVFPAVALALMVAGAVRRSWRLAAVGVAALVLAPFAPLIMLFGVPTAFVGLGLLALGVWQRDGFLAGTAAAFTVFAVLDGFGGIANALWRLGVPDGLPVQPAVRVLLGLPLIVAGGIAWQREKGAPRDDGRGPPHCAAQRGCPPVRPAGDPGGAARERPGRLPVPQARAGADRRQPRASPGGAGRRGAGRGDQGLRGQAPPHLGGDHGGRAHALDALKELVRRLESAAAVADLD